jgi:lysophospholipase L1-like esterase
MRSRTFLVATLCALGPVVGHAQSPPPLQLGEGDRVVLLGGSLFEHERFHGYLETRLLRHAFASKITFRNLGWSGDTVRGEARTSGYKNPEGMPRLLKEVRDQKPTVLLVGYGLNESFAGPAGLPAFLWDYARLLDSLAPLKARMVIVSPTFHEDLGRPYPDPAQHNRDLAQYADAIKELADKRGFAFVDLFHPLAAAKAKSPARTLTSNGILLNADGYWLVAEEIERQLRPADDLKTIDFGTEDPKEFAAKGNRQPIRGLLAAPPRPGTTETEEPTLIFRGLPQGRYVLKIAGKVVLVASEVDFAKGIRVPSSALTGEVEALRKTIIVRDDLFYRGWRPFNDHSRHWGFMAKDFELFADMVRQQDRVVEIQRDRAREWEIAAEGDSR